MSNVTYDYTGKVVVITGGGRGLGGEITRAFAPTGATIVITGRVEETLSTKCEEMKKEFGTDISYIVADGSSEEKVNETVAEIAKRCGHIDVLINNAQSETHGVTLEDHTKADFDLAFDTGVYATFFYMKACFPYLKESKGSIINMGSGAGIVGMHGFAAYAANKEAIRGLTRVAATEWSIHGINSNSICPAVETPALLGWAEIHPEEYEVVLSGTAMHRLANGCENVGGTCLFLASPAAKFITGRTFDVDGGQNIRP